MKNSFYQLVIALSLFVTLTTFAKDDIGGGGSLGGGGKLTDMVEDFKIPDPEKEILKTESDLDHAFRMWTQEQSERDKDDLLRKVFKHHIAPQIGK